MSYRAYSSAVDGLALEALSRSAGEPVSPELLKSLFAELLSHDDNCGCGKCSGVRRARIDSVLRSCDYWASHQQQIRSSRKVLG